MKPTEDPRPARLVAITLPSMIDGIGRGSRVHIADPQSFTGWTFSIRGAAVFLQSPRGWTREHHNVPHVWKKDGERQFFEVPRVECRMQWAADDMKAIDAAMQRYDTGVMCRPGVAEAAAVPVRDAKEMGDA